MTREEYKTMLLSKGFVFEQSQDAWSQQRGQEDKSVNSWIVSSNPATYDVELSLTTNGEMDWRTNSDFNVGDIVYIYEVIPSRGGRGGIIYATEVTKTNIVLKDKMDDRRFWQGQAYSQDVTEQTRFIRLTLIGEPNGGIVPLKALREHGFTPPQRGRYTLREPLKSYIESFFSIPNDFEDEAVII